jgi:hypothetical protein
MCSAHLVHGLFRGSIMLGKPTSSPQEAMAMVDKSPRGIAKLYRQGRAFPYSDKPSEQSFAWGGPTWPMQAQVPPQAAAPTMPTLPTQAAPQALAQPGGTGWAGGPPAGLPAQAAPQAAAALAARPALPAQAMGQRPFKRGGKGK